MFDVLDCRSIALCYICFGKKSVFVNNNSDQIGRKVFRIPTLIYKLCHRKKKPYNPYFMMTLLIKYATYLHQFEEVLFNARKKDRWVVFNFRNSLFVTNTCEVDSAMSHVLNTVCIMHLTLSFSVCNSKIVDLLTNAYLFETTQ